MTFADYSADSVSTTTFSSSSSIWTSDLSAWALVPVYQNNVEWDCWLRWLLKSSNEITKYNSCVKWYFIHVQNLFICWQVSIFSCHRLVITPIGYLTESGDLWKFILCYLHTNLLEDFKNEQKIDFIGWKIRSEPDSFD